jgi:hypothetical protein
VGIKGKPGLKVFTSLDPVCLGCGPYEASEGIYLRARQRKTAVGQELKGGQKKEGFQVRKGE